MTSQQRPFTLTLGAFQATLFPHQEQLGTGPKYTVDIYHSGTDLTHPRFICTAEESRLLNRLTLAAESLIQEYLARGRSYEDWCKAHAVNPFDPELSG